MNDTAYLKTSIVVCLMLALCFSGSCANANSHEDLQIVDKTLVAWVYLANLGHRGGSVLTMENAEEEFDAIVFGENPIAEGSHHRPA